MPYLAAMFTGIVEQMGRVMAITEAGSNRSFWIQAAMAGLLRVDQSLAHNGVCLTVEAVENDCYKVTAIAETLAKTTLGNWQKGTVVNLERCMQLNDRLDGHIVQGHVDAVATCLSVTEKAGSWEYSFSFDSQFATLLIEKGSVTINGTSLTVFNVTANSFTVAIIPYTYNHTTIQYLKVGDGVNIEFDVLGKYVNRAIQVRLPQ